MPAPSTRPCRVCTEPCKRRDGHCGRCARALGLGAVPGRRPRRHACKCGHARTRAGWCARWEVTRQGLAAAARRAARGRPDAPWATRFRCPRCGVWRTLGAWAAVWAATAARQAAAVAEQAAQAADERAA